MSCVFTRNVWQGGTVQRGEARNIGPFDCHKEKSTVMGRALKYPNIEAERARMGLTRSVVAFDLGVTKGTYTAWVEGECPIPLEFCMGLTKILKCSLDYLLAPSDPYRWKRYRRVPHGA